MSRFVVLLTLAACALLAHAPRAQAPMRAPEPPRSEPTAASAGGDADDASGPPPPVLPQLRKGVKAQLKRKGPR